MPEPNKQVKYGKNYTVDSGSSPFLAVSETGGGKKSKLKKQDSIDDNRKVLGGKSKTSGSKEMSLDVPVVSTRRYSLPTAQMVEEAREAVYAKKAQKQQSQDSRRTSRADISKAAAGGGGPGMAGNSLLVPVSTARRLSSPNLAPATSASNSRRGSFAATLGLAMEGNQPVSSRRNSAIGAGMKTNNGSTTGLLSGLASNSAQNGGQKKSSENLLGIFPVSISEPKKGKGTSNDKNGILSSWIPGRNNKNQGSNQAAGPLGASLTYRTRLQAFAVCLIGGIVIEVLGCMALTVKNNKKTLLVFLLLLALGNMAMILSTTFLAGFAIQRRQLTEESRLVALIVYVVMTVATVMLAMTLQKPPLLFLAIAIKLLAITWYSLSYIPVARAAIRSCLSA